jgi:hypothetical protein
MTLTPSDAERLTTRIVSRLEVLADTRDAVMPLLREAIEGQAHIALGYPSPGAYAQDRFGGALARLGVEMRREVVAELTAAGLSTRAIAPVVGVSNKTVQLDRQVLPPVTPHLNGEASDWLVTAGEHEPTTEADLARVTGVDGKSYRRTPTLPSAPPLRTPEEINAEQAAEGLARALATLASLQHPHMRDLLRQQWTTGYVAASPVLRSRVNPEHMRVVAQGLLALADEWTADDSL